MLGNPEFGSGRVVTLGTLFMASDAVLLQLWMEDVSMSSLQTVYFGQGEVGFGFKTKDVAFAFGYELPNLLRPPTLFRPVSPHEIANKVDEHISPAKPS